MKYQSLTESDTRIIVSSNLFWVYGPFCYFVYNKLEFDIYDETNLYEKEYCVLWALW